MLFQPIQQLILGLDIEVLAIHVRVPVEGNVLLAKHLLAEPDRHRGVFLGERELISTERYLAHLLAVLPRGFGPLVGPELQPQCVERNPEPARDLLARALEAGQFLEFLDLVLIEPERWPATLPFFRLGNFRGGFVSLGGLIVNLTGRFCHSFGRFCNLRAGLLFASFRRRLFHRLRILRRHGRHGRRTEAFLQGLALRYQTGH